MTTPPPDDTPPRPHRVYVIDDRWTNVRQIVETIAIVAAGFWAFYTFIYQERIKPANEPASLTTSIAIHRLGRDAKRDILVVQNTFKNDGKTEIDVAADGFKVFGIRYASQARRSQRTGPTEATTTNDVPEESRTLVHAYMQLRTSAEHGPVDRHIVLEPDASVTLENTVVVPRGAYDALAAYVVASPIKTPVGRKMAARIEYGTGGDLWLTGPRDNFDEDDNYTVFALIP